MAQVVGHEHDDSFQPMKLPQICLLKLSKDETLTANISEIANNGLPGHLLDDLARLLSANGLCLFESHRILNGNDLDVYWHALCDRNSIKKWDVTYEPSIRTAAEDRQKRRSWKEFYFQWQFYELFRNSLNIDLCHLLKTEFFLFETPKLNEMKVETWHTRFTSLFEETLDFVCFYPRMLQFRKEIVKENRWILSRMTKNVIEVEFCSFLRFKPSHLEVIHDVFAFCDFSRMTTISFRNTKILEKGMSKFKAIMVESCKRDMNSGKAVASKAVYPENSSSKVGSSCQRSQEIKGEERSFKHAFEYLSDRHETVDCTVVTAKCESISDRIYEENDDVQADGQSKTTMPKQGDVISESEGLQAHLQSKMRMTTQEEVVSDKGDFQFDVQSAKRITRQGGICLTNGEFQLDVSSTNGVGKERDTRSENEGFPNGARNKKRLSMQGEDRSENDCLVEYFSVKKRKFLKEETVPIAACNPSDSECRIRTSHVFMPEESTFDEGKCVNSLEEMTEDVRLHVESNERDVGTRDVTFDYALCGDVLESHELDTVVDISTNFIDDGHVNAQCNGQSSSHTPSSSINCDTPHPCSSLEAPRVSKLKFVDCVLNSSSISILCDIIENLPDLRTFYFCSEDVVESVNVDKIVSSILQTSRKDELFRTKGIAQERFCTTEKIELDNCTLGCYSRDYLLWHQKSDCEVLTDSKLSRLNSLALRDCDIFGVYEVTCNCDQRHMLPECQTFRYCRSTDQGWDFDIPCQFLNNHLMLQGYLNDGMICTCNWSSLMFLDLSYNDFWCKGADLLSCVLKTVPVIKVVKLANCKMPTKGCKAIFEMAKDHPSLESLDVTENDYNVSEDGNLARLISDGRLTHLFLRILISPDSLTEEFFDSFSRNATLKSLDLSENRLGTKEMKWFTNVLLKPETLESLEELDLRYNRMPVSSLRDLADAMVTSNRRLHKLNVSDCLKLKGEGLPDGLLKVIKERVDVLSYMPDIDSRVTDFFDYVSVM